MRRLVRGRPTPIVRASGRPSRWVLGVASVLVAVAVLLVGPASEADAAPATPGRATVAAQECTPGENSYNVLIPDGCYGDHPVGAYDITWKSGFNPLRNMLGFLTMLAYSLGNMFISLAQWSIEWAFQFPIQDYTGAATRLSTMYDDRIFGGALGVSLSTVAYTLLFTYVGFNILRNKASMAIGELAASVVLVTCSAFLVNNLTGYVTAMWDLVNHGTAAMLVAADPDSGVSPADADKDDIDGAIRDVQVRLHDVFIDEPYDLLQWGSPLQEPCATRRDEILSGTVETSLWYDFRDWLDGGSGALGTGPDALMGQLSECRQYADFNAEPTWERLGSAILCMLASIAVGLVITAMGVTMVLGNFVVVMLFGVSPFLLLFAALPGSGRRLGWMWLTTLVQAVVVDLGLAFVLSMTLTLMQIVLDVTSPAPDGTGGRPLLERMVLLLCLGLLLSVVRSRMLTASQSSAGRFADNMSNVRMGGGGVPWQGPAGSMGVNFHAAGDAVEKYGAGAVVGTVAALNSARLVYAQRARERRMWHNTVKARLMGDQLSLVSDRSYIGSDLSGSASGVMPRGGYPALGPGGPGAGGVALPVDEDRFAEIAEAHPDNLWVRAIEARETGDQAGFEYYRGMASLHANYQIQANSGGEQRAQEHYEAQAARLRKKYVQRMDGDPGPGLAVPTPWDVAASGADNLGLTRPDLDGPPIAHLAAAREFGESVRHVPVYPGWAWRKPYLWGSLLRGQQTAQNATELQRRVAAERGYDI